MFQTDRRMKSADREQVDEIEIHILELQDKSQRHEWLERGKGRGGGSRFVTT